MTSLSWSFLLLSCASKRFEDTLYSSFSRVFVSSSASSSGIFNFISLVCVSFRSSSNRDSATFTIAFRSTFAVHKSRLTSKTFRTCMPSDWRAKKHQSAPNITENLKTIQTNDLPSPSSEIRSLAPNLSGRSATPKVTVLFNSFGSSIIASSSASGEPTVSKLSTRASLACSWILASSHPTFTLVAPPKKSPSSTKLPVVSD
jgi:hypothetical protein